MSGARSGGACVRRGRVPVPPEVRRVLARQKKTWAMASLHISAAMYDEIIAPYGSVQAHVLEKVVRLLVELSELPTIEELIARSSLGTPEAVATRAQAPRKVVDEVLRKVGGGR
jgi:hypothetical protein